MLSTDTAGWFTAVFHAPHADIISLSTNDGPCLRVRGYFKYSIMLLRFYSCCLWSTIIVIIMHVLCEHTMNCNMINQVFWSQTV